MLKNPKINQVVVEGCGWRIWNYPRGEACFPGWLGSCWPVHRMVGGASGLVHTSVPSALQSTWRMLNDLLFSEEILLSLRDYIILEEGIRLLYYYVRSGPRDGNYRAEIQINIRRNFLTSGIQLDTSLKLFKQILHSQSSRDTFKKWFLYWVGKLYTS